MPFTQEQLDDVFATTCRYYGVSPEEFIPDGAPLLGCDVPVERQARAAFEAARRARLLGGNSVKMFVPTKDWQVVGDDDVLPPGCEIDMSMTTGKKVARLRGRRVNVPSTVSRGTWWPWIGAAVLGMVLAAGIVLLPWLIEQVALGIVVR